MAHTAFTNLRSARLTLRRLQPSDLAALCAYRSDPRVARYQSWETFTTADGQQLLEEQAQLEPDIPGTWCQLAIERTADAVLLGDCGFYCRQDDPSQAAIGITLAVEHQGRGHAYEALTCLLDYAFLARNKHRVVAVTDAENTPAAALLERLGFRREGHFLQNIWFKDRWGDEFAFAILRAEWEQRRPG
jgi:RimJ/RimL family protein N-acetyltransferase